MAFIGWSLLGREYVGLVALECGTVGVSRHTGALHTRRLITVTEKYSPRSSSQVAPSTEEQLQTPQII